MMVPAELAEYKLPRDHHNPNTHILGIEIEHYTSRAMVSQLQRELHRRCDPRNIVRLHRSIRHCGHIFLLLEYVPKALVVLTRRSQATCIDMWMGSGPRGSGAMMVPPHLVHPPSHVAPRLVPLPPPALHLPLPLQHPFPPPPLAAAPPRHALPSPAAAPTRHPWPPSRAAAPPRHFPLPHPAMVPPMRLVRRE
ncbi:unnamed protein product [Vitrella brassicaformis CCMP3155]|uniref:Protein kinase domain-containing protein n=1 Tax=Vitrella brassicaformis (strain CCMP3155) TaxID=1169540 RepID=A0A0G4EA62_VITBC|nr:unnamed protein product [Vitrella brassicaformis CCMP3155]|eukprot:CEL92837.1 unnamed protein product [Vitrella brassicaformis CCMP3155]